MWNCFIVFAYIDEKPYQCDVCDTKFQKTDFKRHWLRMHSDNKDNKPHKCTECPKAYATRTDFMRHMRSHTGQAQYSYSCKQCSKSFTARKTLKNHMLIHTGEKPFSWDTCGMSFRYKRTLQNHCLVHTNRKHNL